jgi:hypothetical protein
MNKHQVLDALDKLGEWSPWVPFDRAVDTAPREPGVYMARTGRRGAIVYIGHAGERLRSEPGIRGRLTAYVKGNLVRGLGGRVADRAFADPVWVRERLEEVERGSPRPVAQWGMEAFIRADLYIRWATTADKETALRLEAQCQALCPDLWD